MLSPTAIAAFLQSEGASISPVRESAVATPRLLIWGLTPDEADAIPLTLSWGYAFSWEDLALAQMRARGVLEA